ncbi:MAG: Asp-tRNA(Asn)/Glu-tRNA(Gln) amidotransferase subunit GatA [Chlamydiota bacterium]
MYRSTALDIRRQFITGIYSAQEIAEYYLDRIEHYNPQIGAFLAVYKEQSKIQARKLDKKLAAGQHLGKLAGVPIALKDNVHVKGEITTCASQILTHYRPPFTATAVELLEKEDAIIIGKTNLDEFAMGSSTENSAFQLTKNPWNLKCTPGGSSGGSVAAVAARLCPISLGSDTGGSIRQPAAFSGVVGFKPSYGRVSRHGLVSFASSLDQIGPITTSVKDIAILMEVLGQPCTHDSTCRPYPIGSLSSKLATDLAGVKIGVPWNFIKDCSPQVHNTFLVALQTLQDLGACILDIDMDILKYSIATYNILGSAEASSNLARFDGIRYGRRSSKAKNLEELYEYSKDEGLGAEVKRRILLGTFFLSSENYEAFYLKAQQVRTMITHRYREIFTSCDLVATPTSPHTAFPIGSTQDPLEMSLEDSYLVSANLAGLPSISLPAGFDAQHLPVGLQLTGPQFSDDKVCALAHAYEHANAYYQNIPAMVQ